MSILADRMADGLFREPIIFYPDCTQTVSFNTLTITPTPPPHTQLTHTLTRVGSRARNVGEWSELRDTEGELPFQQHLLQRRPNAARSEAERSTRNY